MDRRTTPFSGRVAATRLQGIVEAEVYGDGDPMQVRGNPFLLAQPAGRRDRQLLTGDGFVCLDRAEGWAYGMAGKDGYCGWLPEAALVEPVAPTHRVIARTSWVYPDAGVREPPLFDTHFGALVRVLDVGGAWARVLCGGDEGFLPVPHLRPLDERETDPATVLRLFLGTPYLWAGNTGFGIDCSGLVQAALLACGRACPGDSDLQEQALGAALPEGAPGAPGDLWFWPGHVAMQADADMLIHATGHAMSVIEEPVAAALDRIAAAGTPLSSHRRLTD
jgi:hypothetical protein